MTYSPNPQHRNRTPEKSQWSISLAQEIACFNTTYANQWIDNNNGWGLHYSEGRLDYLGLAQDYITRVFIAKFVGGSGELGMAILPIISRINRTFPQNAFVQSG